MNNSIGVDIGGSHVTSGMFRHLDKELIDDSLCKSKMNTEASKEAILSNWSAAIAKSISSNGSSTKGIGFAMPGPFDYYQGVSFIKGLNKLSSLYNENIRDYFSKEFEIEPNKIRFINDATAFSLAEAVVGRAKDFDNILALTIGTGFGSSFLNKQVPQLEGPNIPEGGFLYNQDYKGRIADETFSTRGIMEYYHSISPNQQTNVRDIKLLADSGDEKAVATFRWFGKELSTFLAPYAKERDAIIIGGNIAKAHAHFLDVLKQDLPYCPILISDLGENAAIIGSALLLDDNFYEPMLPIIKKM